MKKTKKYRGLFIVSPEKEDQIESVMEKVRSVITENTGSVSEENLLGKRELAYPIKKQQHAVYLEVAFDAEPASIAEMTRQYRIDTDLLRTLIDRQE